MLIWGTGCSSISKFTLLEQTKPSEWTPEGAGYVYQHVRLSTPAYGIVRDSLDIAAVAGPRVGNPLFLGPPLVPVIPDLILLFPGSVHDQLFNFDLRIQNRSHSARELDLSKIEFTSHGVVMEPERTLVLYHGCFGQRDDADGCGSRYDEPLRDPHLNVAPFNTMAIRFWFSNWHTDVKDLQVSMDDAFVSSPLPPLILKRKSKVKYIPVIFPSFNHFAK